MRKLSSNELLFLFNNKVINKLANKKIRNKAIKLLIINLLLFSIVLIVVLNYKQIDKQEKIISTLVKNEISNSTENHKNKSVTTFLKKNKSIEPDIATDNNILKIPEIAKIVNNKTNEKGIINVNTTNIFKIYSTNPKGFYVLVGSFHEAENAQKKQKMNRSQYTCYIFDKSEQSYNRVGLFISSNDRKKAEKSLKNILKIQPDSWLVYNYETDK